MLSQMIGTLDHCGSELPVNRFGAIWIIWLVGCGKEKWISVEGFCVEFVSG